MNLFKKEIIFKGNIVSLKEVYRVDEKTAYDGIPEIDYDIYLNETNERIGNIQLCFSNEGFMYYFGNVGYDILKEYRGHNYAYYACLLLFEIAYTEFGLKELIITCSPENIASYKTLMKLNGEFVEKVNVPSDHELYKRGEKEKYIFRYKIGL